jgi:hypothetical protein
LTEKSALFAFTLNSQQKRLKKVDEKQQELAKREKGFTLYLNGANAALPHSVPADMAVKVTRTARRPKTQRSKAPTQETNNANGMLFFFLPLPIRLYCQC